MSKVHFYTTSIVQSYTIKTNKENRNKKPSRNRYATAYINMTLQGHFPVQGAPAL